MRLVGAGLLFTSYVISRKYGDELGINGTLEWLILASFATPTGILLLWGGRLSRMGVCLALIVGYIISMIALFDIGKHV